MWKTHGKSPTFRYIHWWDFHGFSTSDCWFTPVATTTTTTTTTTTAPQNVPPLSSTFWKPSPSPATSRHGDDPPKLPKSLEVDHQKRRWNWIKKKSHSQCVFLKLMIVRFSLGENHLIFRNWMKVPGHGKKAMRRRPLGNSDCNIVIWVI